MTAYKLFRVRKDGSLGSLYINKRDRLDVGVWLDAQTYETKGFKIRKGWHCVKQPYAPHLSGKKEHREWRRVEVKKCKKLSRPKYQGGEWILAEKMKIVG